MRTPQPRFPAYVGLPLTPPSLPARSRAEWHQWRTPPCCCSCCDAGAYPTASRARGHFPRTTARRSHVFRTGGVGRKSARINTPARAARAVTRCCVPHGHTRRACARGGAREGGEGEGRGGAQLPHGGETRSEATASGQAAHGPCAAQVRAFGWLVAHRRGCRRPRAARSNQRRRTRG